MKFPHENDLENSLWWDMMTDEPDLGEGLEELTNDPEAGVVAAVGIFAILKLRFWHRLPRPISDGTPDTHQTDDAPPPQASIDGLIL